MTKQKINDKLYPLPKSIQKMIADIYYNALELKVNQSFRFNTEDLADLDKIMEYSDRIIQRLD